MATLAIDGPSGAPFATGLVDADGLIRFDGHRVTAFGTYDWELRSIELPAGSEFADLPIALEGDLSGSIEVTPGDRACEG